MASNPVMTFNQIVISCGGLQEKLVIALYFTFDPFFI